MLYFAYGSNMSAARIRARVEAVPLDGYFVLPGYRLVFNKKGRDDSAKANIIVESNSTVYGRVFQLSVEEKFALDQIEGDGYACEKVSLVNEQGNELAGYCYIAVDITNEMQPFDWYLTHILTGALESSVPNCYIDKLSSVATISDENVQRKAFELSVYSSTV